MLIFTVIQHSAICMCSESERALILIPDGKFYFHSKWAAASRHLNNFPVKKVDAENAAKEWKVFLLAT